MATELDYMEYATDAAAQAAYPTNATDEVVDQEQTAYDDYIALGHSANVGGAESFQVSVTGLYSSVEIREDAAKVGSPTGNWQLRIETNNVNIPSGTLVSAGATVTVSPPGTNTVVKGTFASPVSLSTGVTYWLVPKCDAQAGADYWKLSVKSGLGTGANLYGGTWTVTTWGMCFKVYRFNPSLQSYSEATIKTQGSYALKGVAAITDSLNKTLTRTIGSPIDLTGQTQIKFDIYSSRTGANIKIGIYDATVPTTTEKTYTVLSANTWETVVWDISAVTDANKNAISKIIVTILDADAANTFYLDNMYAGDKCLTGVIYMES